MKRGGSTVAEPPLHSYSSEPETGYRLLRFLAAFFAPTLRPIFRRAAFALRFMAPTFRPTFRRAAFALRFAPATLAPTFRRVDFLRAMHPPKELWSNAL